MDKMAIDIMIWLAHEMRDRDYPLFKTRLIKLLYLVEIEFYRRKRLRLTNLEWEFYKFGPYVFGVDNLLEKAGFEQESIDGLSESSRRILPSDWSDRPDIEFGVRILIDQVVRRWGDADIRDILDYAYYETEPMLAASFRDRLDFSTVRKSEPRIALNIPRDQLHQLRSRLQTHLRSVVIEEIPKPIAGAEEEADSMEAIGGEQGEKG